MRDLALSLFPVRVGSVHSLVAGVTGMHGIPKILDFGDMDSQKWLEYARYRPFPLAASYWVEMKKLGREEKHLAGLFDLCAAKKLGNLPGVRITGSVANVRPYLRCSALVVAPLNIARGTQKKILGAMAFGVPVVASRVAAGWVDAVANEHFLVREHTEGIRTGRAADSGSGDLARKAGTVT